MLAQLARLKGAALGFLFQPYCIGCGKEGAFICLLCQHTLPRIAPPICPMCGSLQPDGILCPDCLGWQGAIDVIHSPFRFKGAVREAVHSLKYENLRALVAPLGVMLRKYLVDNALDVEILLPVSLHPKCSRERGYNQAELLDDISTSRTTLDTCAAVLKAEGISSVYGLVMAREI